MKKKVEVNQVEDKPEIKIKLEELRLLCRKCGKEWLEEKPLGYRVRCEKDNNYLISRTDPEKKKYFKCPECKSWSKISRLPAKQTMKIR